MCPDCGRLPPNSRLTEWVLEKGKFYDPGHKPEPTKKPAPAANPEPQPGPHPAPAVPQRRGGFFSWVNDRLNEFFYGS